VRLLSFARADISLWKTRKDNKYSNSSKFRSSMLATERVHDVAYVCSCCIHLYCSFSYRDIFSMHIRSSWPALTLEIHGHCWTGRSYLLALPMLIALPQLRAYLTVIWSSVSSGCLSLFHLKLH